MSAYNHVTSHTSMLFDAVRNKAYEEAILNVITPDTVVLDLGAGLGLHGLIAAKAGAKKVYLLDSSPVVHAAQQVAAFNGLSNIECICSSVEDVELPEKVDVIISVFTGNFLLSEDLLPALFLARDKWLKADGILIPDQAKMHACPVEINDFYHKNINVWQDLQSEQSLSALFGLDYSCLLPYVVNTAVHKRFNDESVSLLSTPQQLAVFDFGDSSSAECFSDNTFTVGKEGLCHAWLGWFSMRLGNKWYSTAPDSIAMHWSQVCMSLAEPQHLTVGASIRLELKWPQYGELSWFTTTQRRYGQSTFLSKPKTMDSVKKASNNYVPVMNRKAELLKDVLLLCDGHASVEHIAQQLFGKYIDLAENHAELLGQIKKIVSRYDI